jgi:hypothetical protein
MTGKPLATSTPSNSTVAATEVSSAAGAPNTGAVDAPSAIAIKKAPHADRQQRQQMIQPAQGVQQAGGEADRAMARVGRGRQAERQAGQERQQFKGRSGGAHGSLLGFMKLLVGAQ